jgi:hypothetical protein
MWDTYVKNNLNIGLARPLGHAHVGTAVGSVLFDPVPSGYMALACVWSARTTAALTVQSMSLRVNSDASALYDYQYVYGTGTVAATDGQGLTSGPCGHYPGASATTDSFGAGIFWIPDYADATHHTTWYGVSAAKWGTAAGNQRSVAVEGIYAGTAALTALMVFSNGGNFVVGSRFTLFGLGLV